MNQSDTYSAILSELYQRFTDDDIDCNIDTAELKITIIFSHGAIYIKPVLPDLIRIRWKKVVRKKNSRRVRFEFIMNSDNHCNISDPNLFDKVTSIVAEYRKKDVFNRKMSYKYVAIFVGLYVATIFYTYLILRSN